MDSGGEAFSSIDIVTQCLLDKPRVSAFEKAIKKQVRRGDHVLDVGTGSGIMALLAARAGAGSVTALEFDPHLARLAADIVASNGLSKTITILKVDARNYRFPQKQKPFDVVIMEMLTTAMIDEFQVQATNNLLRQGLITKKTRLVPERQETLVTAGVYSFEKYGFTMPTIYHIWRFMAPHARVFQPLTKRVMLSDVSFHVGAKEKFSKKVALPVTKAGEANCILIESRSTLAPGVSVGDTDSLNGPVVIPIPPRKLARGKTLPLTLNYTFGGGYRTLAIK